MDRRVINTLFVNDDDLECDCKNKTLEDITIKTLSFSLADLKKFDMIIYKGSKGEKILRSNFTGIGEIKK